MNRPPGWTDAREAFVLESNRIERIDVVSPADREAHTGLWSQRNLITGDVIEFVRAVAGSQLRDRAGMDVFITGVDFTPPPGGSGIVNRLADLLDELPHADPYRWHVDYESLHPFTDGNGRSGRALWAWQMMHRGDNPFWLGFLHAFYYQSLNAGRA